jgi:hypothetical protein
MFISIPLLSFLLFWYVLNLRFSQGRLAFVAAAALWGVIVAVLTETLSLFQTLSFLPLVIAWSLVLLGAAFWTFKDGSSLKNIQFEFLSWPLMEKILLVSIVVIGAVKGYSALMSAPNTADAMTYHLNRVEHWIQNKTVANYPTHVLRQLYSAPWAEYAILHLRILSGSDYFSNGVQWFAAVGSWIGVSAIAQLLGANRRGQLLAALLAATMPMTLVQATSTQNDYVVTFWLVAFILSLGLTFYQKTWPSAVASAGCLGLALLSKGTAYIYAPVWLILYFLISIKDTRRLKLLGLILALAFLINLPFGLRNTATFGSPYWTHIPFTNDTISLNSLKESLTRSIEFHLSKPTQQSTGEDDTANFLYTILLGLFSVGIILYPSSDRQKHMFYVAALAAMLLALLVIVKDLSWNSRFQLSIFVLSCALIGAAAELLLRRWILLLGVLVIICSWPWLLKCNEHPFLGDKSILRTSREQQYFSERPQLNFPYTEAVKIIQSRNCRDVGLIDGENEWGYPWWVLFHQAYGYQYRLEDVEIKNRSASLNYPRGSFDPCMLITSNDQRTVIDLPSGMYMRAWFMELPQGLTSVFVKVR